ncbi:hypothetical protein KI688_003403 [Linnemannia hyalina]|uniref:Uncharacterized protein n=1 Tax=Linnemannia hyalina TaxID=64524 RepID=A0A9P7XMU7_9FUNG|nr:hypothetical protein KI688_003403 [Linnemannia hyalina]
MSTLPAFKEACLASDITRKSVSLVGSVNGGELEVYSISLGDLSAATSTFKVKDVTPLIAWSPSLPKYCFASPSDMSTIFSSVDVTVVQFGETETFMGSFGTGDRSSVPVSVPALAGGSPKLFALSAASSKKEIFNAYVKGDPGPGKAWRGLLVDLEQPIASKQIRADKGTGYSVIIDGGGTSGTTFPANGDTSISATSDSPFLTFGSSVPVLMNGNVLSDKAVPVSMTGISYILDQDTSTRTVVIYSIKSLDTYGLGGVHDFAANLTKIIPSSGYTPLYSGSLVATYLGKTIVTYSLGSDNKPSMNSFDIATSKWTEVNFTAGSSSGGGGGGLSTALSVVVYVASFLVILCLIRCFWGTIKGLFFCITGKPKNDEVYVVQEVPDQSIALEKINDYPQRPQPIVYIDNSVNTTIDNNSSNNNNVNTNNSVNNSVNNNSVNTNNSVNHNNSANNNSVNNNSVNNNSVNNHSVNNSGNVMGIQPAPGAATPSTVFGTPAPQYPSSPYSQPPYSPSPQYHADPYSYSAPSSHFQSAGSPPTPMATTPQQFYAAPPPQNYAAPAFPQHQAASPPPQVYDTSYGSQQHQQHQQPNW